MEMVAVVIVVAVMMMVEAVVEGGFNGDGRGSEQWWC